MKLLWNRVTDAELLWPPWLLLAGQRHLGGLVHLDDLVALEAPGGARRIVHVLGNPGAGMTTPGALLAARQHRHPIDRPAAFLALGEGEGELAVGAQRGFGLGLGQLDLGQFLAHVAPVTAQAHGVHLGSFGQLVQADLLLQGDVHDLGVGRQAIQRVGRDADHAGDGDGVGLVLHRRGRERDAAATCRIVASDTLQGVTSGPGIGGDGRDGGQSDENELLRHGVLLARGWVMRCA